MIKSELIERISSQNPHLFERVIEKVVNAILDEMVEALRRGDSSRTAGVRSLFGQAPRSTHGAQPPYWCCRRGRRESSPFFKTGKEMRARLNRETVPSD